MKMVFTEFQVKMDFTPIERSIVSPMIKNRDKLVENTINEAGDLFLKLVRFYAPRDKGDYAKSWKILQKSSTSVTIGTNLKTLFLVLEFGIDHEVKIEAKNADSLHWKDSSGVDHFAKFVIIPPRKAQPHIRRAIKDLKNNWRHIALAQMGELIPAFKTPTRRNRDKIEQLKSKLNRPN